MKRVMAAFALLCAPAALRAQGGPPLITDDPGTAALHTWEINTAWILDKSPGHSDHDLPLFDFNYGLRSNVQLKLEFPISVSSEAHETHHELGNFNAGVKWRFLDGVRGIDVATYPQLELPHSFFLPVEIARRFHWLDVNVDAGVWLSGEERKSGSVGFAVGRAIKEGFELLAECNAHGARVLHPDVLYCGVGTRADISSRFIFIGAYEPRVDAPAGDRPAFHSYIGIQTILK